MWEYGAITEGGSCAARADSHAAHSLQPGSPVSKVLYLSDIHFDKSYTAGLNAECGELLCCRPPNGPPREPLCLYTCSNSCTRCDRSPPLPILTLALLQLLASVQPAPGVTTTATVPCRPWRPCCSMSATRAVRCARDCSVCVHAVSLLFVLCLVIQFDWVYITGGLPPHNV